MMPKMSEKVLSYTMNSRDAGDSPPTLGMMMALLMMDSGMPYTTALTMGMPKAKCKNPAMAPVLSANATSARVALRKIRVSLSRRSSNSSAASNTMKINPTVPSSSNTNPSKGISWSPTADSPWRMPMPIAISTRTLGMLVRLANRLAK